MLHMWLERTYWDGLVTWREKMRETGYQLADIWLSQEMLERVDQGRGGRMLWKTTEKMWSSEAQRQLEGSSYGENVRPVRARKRDVK